MRHHTKRHGKRMSSRRRGRRVMKGGFLQALNPHTYVSSPNASDAATYETATVGTLNQQMQASDSSAYSHSNAMDYARINPSIMSAAQSGATAMQGQSSQTGGRKRQNQYQNQQQYQNQFQQQNQFQNQFQKQYQNQQQNQKGGVWNQMIGEAVAPLVLLGLQQYYGPRSKSNKGYKGYKGKRTRRFRK